LRGQRENKISVGAKEKREELPVTEGPINEKNKFTKAPTKEK
jgi:hypothetical protein